MPQVQRSDPAAPVIAELVKRCQALSQSAEAALVHLPREREAFLVTSLGDVLAQLELVLRAVGQEPGGDSKRTDERKSFLKKLFGRSQAEEHPFAPPRFDVTRQGLQGNASTVSIAELLSFLAMGRKNGVLWIDTPEENFMIGLANGSIVHAASDHTPEGLRLGEVLVGMGFLTRRQLDRFVEQTKGDKKEPIAGEFLVKNGMISGEELQSALKQQIHKLVQRVVQAKTALFRFREGMEISMAHSVLLDVNHVLLETARAHDEAANADLRQDAATHTWNSWQGALTAEVEAATGKPLDGPTAGSPTQPTQPAEPAKVDPPPAG